MENNKNPDYTPPKTTIFGGSKPDTISFEGSRLPGGMYEHDYWYDDGISFVGNPHSCHSTDTIKWSDNSLNEIQFNLNMTQTKNHLWKYNEDKILKDIEDYVTSTYHGHYCGDEDGYADIQTIDLMAAKKLAAGFCQANILKYGSRYGDKDGRNKRDLMKVIHYAMLLLHFDGHYTRKDNGLTEFSR